MERLPRYLTWENSSTRWASILDPVIKNPITNGQQIDAIILVSGVPRVVYHSLGQMPQGFIVVDSNAAASVFRPLPATNNTITIEASANVTVSIWVY